MTLRVTVHVTPCAIGSKPMNRVAGYERDEPADFQICDIAKTPFQLRVTPGVTVHVTPPGYAQMRMKKKASGRLRQVGCS